MTSRRGAHQQAGNVEDDKEWNDWVENQDEGQTTKDLFSEKTFEFPGECITAMRKQYGFDLTELRKKFKLETYSQIKFLNWLRKNAPKGDVESVRKFVTELPSKFSEKPVPWNSDKFLQPEIPDDPLLLFEDETESWSDDDEKTPKFKLENPNPLLQNLQEDDTKDQKKDQKSKEKEEEKSDSESEEELVQLAREIASEDAGYFGTYAHYEIHNDMLKDEIRTKSYRDFIYNNPHLIKDKVIMDVGCGTGILSMFAAKTGARKVIAVDHSDILKHAQDNIQENGFQNVITCVKSKVELINDLKKAAGEEKVDIIISEWMGYCLLFECMLPSVLIARDRFCSPTGLVFPDVAEMFLSAFSSKEYMDKRVTFWENVYEFKMNSIKNKILNDPQVDTLPPGSLVSTIQSLKSFDINAVSINDLDFQTNFSLEINSENEKDFHGFVVYFDIHFKKNCTNPIFFSTGPDAPHTHWHQTLFLLKPPHAPLRKGDTIIGNFKCKRRQHHRDLELHIRYKINRATNNNSSNTGDSEWIDLPFMLL